MTLCPIGVGWCGFMWRNLRGTYALVHTQHENFFKGAYFLGTDAHHVRMSQTCVRDTSCVTESQWERLYRLIQQRRKILGLTLDGLQAVGGPSPKWVQNVQRQEGEPSDRMRRPMRKLDLALRWPVDTSWNLVSYDRSSWDEILLTDEEEQLMEQVDEADEFAYVVAARVRAIPAGEERDAVMRQVLAVLGVRP